MKAAHIQPIIVDSNKQLLRMLYKDRVDIAIMSKDNALPLIKQTVQHKKSIIITPIKTYNLHHFIKNSTSI